MISASDWRLDSVGSNISGRCPCSTAMNCQDPQRYCNCDFLDERENEDSGVIVEPAKLAITRAFFLASPNLTESSEGRFTLSPLKCIDLSKYTNGSETIVLYCKSTENDFVCLQLVLVNCM